MPLRGVPGADHEPDFFTDEKTEPQWTERPGLGDVAHLIECLPGTLTALGQTTSTA